MLPLSIRLRYFAQRIAPALLLTGTLALAAVLHFGDGGMSGSVQGFAELDTHDVAPKEQGTIFALNTDVGRDVLAGDVIARLDTSTIDSLIEVLRAERKMLEESVEAERARAAITNENTTGDLKRRLAEAREEQLRLAAEAAVIKSAKERLERLVDAKQATKDELYALEAKQAALAPLAAWQPQSIGVIAEQIEKNAKRSDNGAVTQDLEAQVVLADARIRELMVRRDATVIRAPRNGRVVEVFKRRGDFADIGLPIVRIASLTNRIVACLPDGRGVEAEEGMEARVRAKGSAGPPQTASVVAASPVVMELPPPCQTDQNRPVFGRRVLLSLEGPSTFLSGPGVEIDFTRGAERKAARQTEPPTKDAELVFTKLALPQAIADRSRFEPSGLTRALDGDGLLVVSDDTGLEGERIPILFRMSTGGVIAEAPVVVSNIDEITDVESVTSIGDKLFILSSQSRSKNSKRPAARTLFLELSADGASALNVTGSAVFWSALGEFAAVTPSGLGELGLADGNQIDLDIEGMTAMADGSLLLGLKSPLTKDDEAIIWRLRDPSKLVRGGTLANAGLEMFAKVSLPLSHDGEPLAGGVSELVLLADGSLAVSATPSRGDHATGAAFVIKADELSGVSRGGLLRARTIAQFPNRKPEGLVQLPSGDLLVAFDNGSAAGEITTLSAASLR